MEIVWQIISEFPMLLELLIIGVVCVVAYVVGLVVWIFRYYRKTTYYKDTRNGYLYIRFFDHGKYGEYQTYKKLSSLEKDGAKFLFNAIIPREDGRTSEIDVIMLSQKGVFVFESKNYSGWIFGDESQKMWTQSIPQGQGRKSRKERFYNPVMQNRGHIKYLTSFIKREIPTFSVIVFSERCELKKITLHSSDIPVIKRECLFDCVMKILAEKADALSSDDVSEIYSLLYPYTQLGEEALKKHIEDIKNDIAE